MRRKSDHKDRGDGICGECLEDFPCAIKRGGYRSELEEWEHEERLAEQLEESNRRQALIREINDTFDALGIEHRVPNFCRGFMVSITDLHTLCEAARNGTGLAATATRALSSTPSESEEA